MKKTGGLIMYMLFIVVLLAGSIGGILYATNGGTTGPRLFDITYNDVNADNQVIPLSNFGEPITFNISSKFGKKSSPSLQVRSLPNDNSKNVRFIIDNKDYTLNGIKDLSALFNITIDGDIITVSSSWDLVGFLADYYNVSREVVKLVDYKQGSFSFVDLCFISGNITIKCGLIEFVEVTEIIIDKNTVIIGG